MRPIECTANLGLADVSAEIVPQQNVLRKIGFKGQSPGEVAAGISKAVTEEVKITKSNPVPLFATHGGEGEKITIGCKAAIFVARRAGDIEGHKTIHALGVRLAACHEPLEARANHSLISGQSGAQFPADLTPDQLGKIILIGRQGRGRAAGLHL